MSYSWKEISFIGGTYAIYSVLNSLCRLTPCSGIESSCYIRANHVLEDLGRSRNETHSSLSQKPLAISVFPECFSGVTSSFWKKNTERVTVQEASSINFLNVKNNIRGILLLHIPCHHDAMPLQRLGNDGATHDGLNSLDP